jgi:hypothetical protein
VAILSHFQLGGEKMVPFCCPLLSPSLCMVELIGFLLDEASEVCGTGVCSQEMTFLRGLRGG